MQERSHSVADFRTSSALTEKGSQRARKGGTGWLCSQSAANCSPPANSLIRGKIQGISSISGPWRVLGPSNLNRLVAKFPTQQNREFNRENSEFFLRNREAYADKSEDDDGASDGRADA